MLPDEVDYRDDDDPDDAYCEGDIDPNDVDWDAVTSLEQRFATVESKDDARAVYREMGGGQ